MDKVNKDREAYNKACEMLGIKTHVATRKEIAQGIVLRDGNDRYIVNSSQQVKIVHSKGKPRSVTAVVKDRKGRVYTAKVRGTCIPVRKVSVEKLLKKEY